MKKELFNQIVNGKHFTNTDLGDGKLYKVEYVDCVFKYQNIINELLLEYHLHRVPKKDFKMDKPDKVSKYGRRKQYIFRGIKDIKEAFSTLKRNEKETKEFDYIKKFEENGCLKLGQFNNAIDMAAAARHYGIRARLIDWSYSPLVATLFALNEKDAEIIINNEKYYCLECKDYYENCLTLHMLDFDVKYRNSSFSIQYRSMIEKYDELLKHKQLLVSNIGESISNIPNRIEDFSKEAKRICLNSKNENGNDLVDSFLYVENYMKNVYAKTNFVKDINNFSVDEMAIVNKMIKRFLKRNVTVFLETNFSNERLKHQRGIFEVEDIYNIFSDSRNIPYLILIKESARIEIIKYINRLGINYYMLNDDTDYTTKTINRTIEDELKFNDKIEYNNKSVVIKNK